MDRAKLDEILSRVETLAAETTERALWINEGREDISPQGAELAFHLFTIAAGLRAMRESE